MVLLCSLPQIARANTTCSFGGPTPGFRAMQFSLPSGSQFLTIEFTSSRPTMPVGDRSSWHFAQGIGVIDAATNELVAWKVVSQGSSPRRATIEYNGEQPSVHQEFTGPDAPFTHTSVGLVPSLAPGTYDIVAFGTDGDTRLPNPWWGGFVEVSAPVQCTPLGSGDIIDKDQTDFSGGTQAMVYGAGVAQNETLKVHTDRSLVFGIMDAATQLEGSATLDYSMPGNVQGIVSNSIQPFASTQGDYSFAANYSGLFPLISIDATALDLS
ncbi:MAG: hypothetical protein ACYDCC_10915 [Actinomycetota bacterium]